jgi:uncharacterized protein with HEPN domain
LSRRDDQRLQDIRAAIQTIRNYVASESFDGKTSDAVLYNLVVIGEAAGQLSAETREKAPQIPWHEVVGLRNLIAHEYFRVDLEVIETIVDERLPALDNAAESLLAETQE